jgi:hypothetical protein
MKKIILSAFTLLTISIAANAQTTRDWYLIGGDIGKIGLDFQEDNTAFSLEVTPRVAWFIRDNLALGAEVLIGLNTAKGFTQVDYGVGPIARYYLTTRAVEAVRKSRWFFEGNVGFRGSNTKVSGQSAVNTNGLGIGFGPGLAYFVNQNIALEVLPKYNLTVGFGNSTTNNALDIRVGFQIYLPKAKLRSMQSDVK